MVLQNGRLAFIFGLFAQSPLIAEQAKADPARPRIGTSNMRLVD